MKAVLGLLYCICCIAVTVSGDDVAKSESDLRKALFENYDKLVRPVTSLSHVVPVTANLYPIAIKDVDVNDKIVKLDTWFFIRWVDEFLSWNPDEYGGFTQLTLPAAEVWRPDLSIYHATPDENLSPKVHTNVVVFNNGTVIWVPPFTVKTQCPPTENQVTDDTFECKVQLGSWTYDVTQLDLHEYVMHVLQVDPVHFIDNNPKWTLDSVTASRELKYYSCCVEGYPLLTYDMKFRKRNAGGDH